MKLNFNRFLKVIRYKCSKNFLYQKTENLFNNEDYLDCLLSFLYLAFITSKLLENEKSMVQMPISECVSETFDQHDQLTEKNESINESIHENYELIIECLEHDLEQQKSTYVLEKENLQLEILNLEKNQCYLKQQLVEQFNLNSEYESTISVLNQKIEFQSEQLELSRSNLNIIENKLKSLEEQLEIVNIKSLDQPKKLEADVMVQEDKIKLEDSLSAYMELVEEKDMLLNQAAKEILELKNDLYEQKKQFSETSKQYEEEIEQLRQENIYYKNLKDGICSFEKEETSKKEVNELKNELQAAMVQLEGIKASAEIEESDEIETIRRQLVQKIEEIAILQDVISHQKKEIFELRSLLVEGFQESDGKEMDRTLEHLKKKLQEAVDETTLFCNETFLEQ